MTDDRAHKVDRTVDALGREPDGVWVLFATVAVVGQHLPLCPRPRVPVQ